MNNELVPQGNAGLPAVMAGMYEDAGQGQNFGSSDIAVPFFGVLQSGSPQVKEEDPKYVEGARPGMVLNNVTKRLYDVRILPGKSAPQTITAVLAAYVKSDAEWVPRGSGGGFRGDHAPNSLPFKNQTVVIDGKERTVRVLPNGNNLVETAYYFPIMPPENEGDEYPFGIISMSSTQLGVSRAWNSFLKDLRYEAPTGARFKPPIFGVMVNLNTIPQENSSGTWWGWKIEHAGPVSDPILYASAKKYAEDVASGRAKAVMPADETADKDEAPF